MQEEQSYTLEEISEAAELYPSLWVEKYGIKNEVGMPIEFNKRKFLRDIYDDLSPHQVILKPPQIGLTICNTLKSLYVAKKLNRQIIYTLPTQGDVQAMVGGSFNRIIAQNPILQEWVKDHDTIEQKSVGDSIIFYRGTFTAKQAMMIPSGLNIHDEVDASDPLVITQYENRLQAQEDGGWRWYFSHPSLVGTGVDLYWQKSDKKEWVITCPECNQMQILTWPRSVSRGNDGYICKQCNSPLSQEARINGEWYNRDGEKWSGILNPKYEFSGWHVSQLMLYNKSAKDIYKVHDDPLKDKQFFSNFVLGMPYEGGDDQITVEQVLNNCVDETNSQEGRIIIGVDPGLPVHYVLMNKEGVFYYGTCKEPKDGYDPYDDIRFLLKQYPRSVVISDQGGDLNPMRVLQQEFPGRIFLAWYRKDRKTLELVKWGEGTEYGSVIIDRNRYIQVMMGYLKEGGRIRLNGDKQDWREYADHFANMYREKVVVKEQKDKDDKSLYGAEYVWKRKGPDHWAHATLYATVGMQKYGQSLATVSHTSLLDSMEKGQIISDDGVMLRFGDGSIAF